MDMKIAQKTLEKYTTKHHATYHGIPVMNFTRDELIKIIDMYAELVDTKDKTIIALSKLRI